MNLRCQFRVVRYTDDMLFLVDECGWNDMSMTNDAEAVCGWADAWHPGKRVMYRDTMGNWDEMVHENGIFKDFKPGFSPDLELLDNES